MHEHSRWWGPNFSLLEKQKLIQSVRWGAVTPGCKHGSGWPRYRMPNAGVEGMSKVGTGSCPSYSLLPQLFWFPFRIKAQPWFMKGEPALPTTFLTSLACCCRWSNPTSTVHHPQLMSCPEMHLSSASLHTYFLEYLGGGHHLIS